MAKCHVLATSGANTQVALHITVPAGNNSAGIPWATVLKNSGIGGKTVLPDGDGTGGTISAAEKTSVVTNATVYEVVVSTPIPAGMSAATANAFLDALHAAAVIEQQDNIQKQLAQFGFTRV